MTPLESFEDRPRFPVIVPFHLSLGMCPEPRDSPSIHARQQVFSGRGGVLRRAPRDARVAERKNPGTRYLLSQKGCS